MFKRDQLIELHMFKQLLGVHPLRELVAGLLGQEGYLAGHRLAGAAVFMSDFSLPGAAHNIQFDQPVEAALLLAVGGRMSGTGMALSTRFAAIALNALGIVIAMKTTKFHGASYSAAGA